MTFESYKSTICHQVKELGDLRFIIDILQNDKIRTLYQAKQYPKAFYLLGMIDYLSHENGLPFCGNYNDIRSCKLQNPIYPNSILALSLTDKTAFEDAEKNAIPEFKKFNIIEVEVRNVV